MNHLITIFPSWFVPNILLFLFPFIFIILYSVGWKRFTVAGRYKLPPSPPRLPIVGNLHQVIGGKNLHQPLWKLSQKYGPVMLLRFGSQPFLIISSSEMATQVLKTHDQAMCSRPDTKGSKRITFNYMDVAFSPHGDHWRDMRKIMVSDFLGAKRTRLFKKIMETEVNGLVASLSSLSLTTTVNLDEIFLSLVHDVVGKVTFGKSYRGETFNGIKFEDMVDESVELLSGSFSDYFPTFGWIIEELSGWNRRLDKSVRDYDEFFQMVIDNHYNATKKSGDGENDFVDDCISRGLATNEIKGLLMNVLNGGIDTSTTTMLWAMSEFIKNPRVMHKLQNEIRMCVGRKSSILESDITKMSYLKLAVKETLRLHPPPGFLITRECIRHCQIGGYDVFPGTKVLINVWGIGKDPRIWKENSSQFFPERFENLDVDVIAKNCEMVPFGGGRRACPGYNSAISIVEFTLANLLYWFDWETPLGVTNHDLDMEEGGHQLITRKTPLCLVPVSHKWQDLD